MWGKLGCVEDTFACLACDVVIRGLGAWGGVGGGIGGRVGGGVGGRVGGGLGGGVGVG